MTRHSSRSLLASVCILAGLGLTPAAAQDLTIGMASEATSLDPHFHNLATNSQVALHMFEALILRDEKLQMKPGLATSWRLIDDNTWEFKLRKGVKFHDGSEFTVDDVIATFERAPNVPKSPSSFASYIRGKTIEKIDDHTMLIRTTTAFPLMLNELSTFVIHSKAAKDATTEDFNSRKATIGTGPYKITEYLPGDRIVMVRNDNYWGGKPAWGKITLRAMRSDPTRVAALLAGDVDVIEAVPTADIVRIKGNPNLALSETTGARLIYVRLEHGRDNAPFTFAKDGSPIPNPFRNLKVRQALSMAINRPAIVSRIMDGAATPAGQYVPDFIFGASKNLKAQAYDPEGAKKLLAEAGYPNGFKLTLHGPNGRYVNDTKVIEAIAQMYNRIGLDASFETLPPANFFSRAARGADGLPDFSFVMTGWQVGTGEVSDALKAISASFDEKTGFGAGNRARYVNATMDNLLRRALVTNDESLRASILAEASETAIRDGAIIPIHFQTNIWAAKKGITVIPRTDEYTLATGITKQ
jgi:peptide/nickel transport system substrate-binding protein